MAKSKKPMDGMKPNNAFVLEQTPDETGAEAMARELLEPHLRHALTASTFAGKVIGNEIEKPGIMDFVGHVQKVSTAAETGDLAIASRILASQAVTLDTMFTELARRAALNMSEYIDAADRYSRMALKAQSNCRATLEALAKLHQPREQTVKHVHVGRGGQAVVAEEFHHHQGGGNEKRAEQSHATQTTGESSALPSPDPLRDGVPIPGGIGQAAVPDARGH
jgi:hypothetical protein